MTEPTTIPQSPPATLVEAAPPTAVGGAKYSVSFQTRMWSLFILIITSAILGLGLYMTPSPAGYGTHSKTFPFLGDCSFLEVTKVPCPTCGCTTAVTHVAHGRIFTAIRTQPFGAAFGLASVILFVLAIVGLATGRWFGPPPFSIAWYWRRWMCAALFIFIGGWLYKIYAMKHGW